jgi:hypothetical protein
VGMRGGLKYFHHSRTRLATRCELSHRVQEESAAVRTELSIATHRCVDRQHDCRVHECGPRFAESPHFWHPQRTVGKRCSEAILRRVCVLSRKKAESGYGKLFELPLPRRHLARKQLSAPLVDIHRRAVLWQRLHSGPHAFERAGAAAQNSERRSHVWRRGSPPPTTAWRSMPTSWINAHRRCRYDRACTVPSIESTLADQARRTWAQVQCICGLRPVEQLSGVRIPRSQLGQIPAWWSRRLWWTDTVCVLREDLRR